MDRYQYLNIIIVLFCLSMIAYAIKIYFDGYKSKYEIVKGIIKNVNCQRFIVNNFRDEYHCILNIEYKYRNFPISSNLTTEGSIQYYAGDDIYISINKQNPIEITLPNISYKVTATIIILFSIAVLGILFTNNYIDLQ